MASVRQSFSVLVLCSLLSACGGGGGGSNESEVIAGGEQDNRPNRFGQPEPQEPDTVLGPEGVYLFAGMPNETGFSDGAGSQARFTSIGQMELDGYGNLYVVDSGTIRKVTPDGVVTTVAGQHGVQVRQDGTGTQATFGKLSPAIAVDKFGTVYVADSPVIRKVSPSGNVTTIAGGEGRPVADGPAATAGFTQDILNIDLDASGNLYIEDGNSLNSGTIRKLSVEGAVTTVYKCPGTSVACGNLRVDGQGNLYMLYTPVPASAGSGRNVPKPVTQVVPALGLENTFRNLLDNLPYDQQDNICCKRPETVVTDIDALGNVYVHFKKHNYILSPDGYPMNTKVDSFLYKITPSGQATAIAPYTQLDGQALPWHTDPSGIVLPSLYQNQVKVTKRGILYYSDYRGFIGKIITPH